MIITPEGQEEEEGGTEDNAFESKMSRCEETGNKAKSAMVS